LGKKEELLILDMEPARKYPATNMSAEIREALAYVGYQLAQEGRSPAAISQLFTESGSPISRPTIAGYIRKIESGDPPLSHAKSSGASRSLSERDIELLCGFVLWKIEEKKEVHLADGVPSSTSSWRKKCPSRQ